MSLSTQVAYHMFILMSETLATIKLSLSTFTIHSHLKLKSYMPFLSTPGGWIRPELFLIRTLYDFSVAKSKPNVDNMIINDYFNLYTIVL